MQNQEYEKLGFEVVEKVGSIYHSGVLVCLIHFMYIFATIIDVPVNTLSWHRMHSYGLKHLH